MGLPAERRCHPMWRLPSYFQVKHKEHASLGGKNTEFLCVVKADCLPRSNEQGCSVSQEVSSKPPRRMALTQGRMTQDPGLEAWESFSEVSEEESDVAFSLAGGETGKGAFGLDFLRCQPSQGTLCHVERPAGWDQTAASRSREAAGGSYPRAVERVLPLVSGHIFSWTGCPLSSVPSRCRCYTTRRQGGPSRSSLPPISSPQSCDPSGDSQPCGSCLSSVLSSS